MAILDFLLPRLIVSFSQGGFGKQKGELLRAHEVRLSGPSQSSLTLLTMPSGTTPAKIAGGIVLGRTHKALD
ncbi:MAG: hypothetical protein NPIRA03_00050 [Nitrospirales bacterium]|nr:MAG: hypothetical protein NPIRA03_00050 [Nitrospirales bacterium]